MYSVVIKVTGPIIEKTMNALMCGFGAGKTSLINALCGSAFYGKITGDVKINVHDTTIEENTHFDGFVPQDNKYNFCRKLPVTIQYLNG